MSRPLTRHPPTTTGCQSGRFTRATPSIGRIENHPDISTGSRGRNPKSFSMSGLSERSRSGSTRGESSLRRQSSSSRPDSCFQASGIAAGTSATTCRSPATASCHSCGTSSDRRERWNSASSPARCVTRASCLTAPRSPALRATSRTIARSRTKRGWTPNRRATRTNRSPSCGASCEEATRRLGSRPIRTPRRNG